MADISHPSSRERSNRLALKRMGIAALLILCAGALAWALHRHLAAQALSQGFVLQELRPVMDAAIDIGARMQLWQGHFRLMLALGTLLFLLIHIIPALLRGGAQPCARTPADHGTAQPPSPSLDHDASEHPPLAPVLDRRGAQPCAHTPVGLTAAQPPSSALDRRGAQPCARTPAQREFPSRFAGKAFEWLTRIQTGDLNHWLLLVGAILLFMVAAVGTGGFLIYAIGISGFIALGWFGESRRATADASAPLKKGDALALLGILLLALLLRLYQLDVFPARYTVDEQLLAGAALELGEDPLRFFEQPHYMKPHLVKIVGVRAAFSLLGAGLFQHRAVSIVTGVLCVLFVYLLARRLWGNRAGAFAAFLVAIDPWHVGYSKFGVHEIEGPLFLAVMLLALIRLKERGGKKNFALLGLLAGLSLYLYLANMVMAPFAFAAALLVGLFFRKESKGAVAAGLAVMTLAFLVVLVPHMTFGRANAREMLSIYSGSSNFLAAAEYYHVSPARMLLANLSKALATFLQWAPGRHPAAEFHPNALASGLTLLGLGALLVRWRKPANLLILLWIPVALAPAAIGFGFEERRFFATLIPIPMMLAGLALARVWNAGSKVPDTKSKVQSPKSKVAERRLTRAWNGREEETTSPWWHRLPACEKAELTPPRDRVPSLWHRLPACVPRITTRVFILFLLGIIALGNAYIIFADTDSSFGRPAQPRKAAEFVASLPSSCSVVIANRIKDYPFLLHLLNYDKLRRAGGEKNYCFVEFAEIERRADELASNSDIVLLLDPGAQEDAFLARMRKANPEVTVHRARDFWACFTGIACRPANPE